MRAGGRYRFKFIFSDLDECYEKVSGGREGVVPKDRIKDGFLIETEQS